MADLVMADEGASSTGAMADLIDEAPVCEAPICRYCLEFGGGELIAPCACRGDHKFVHRECLKRWQCQQQRPGTCEICRSYWCVRLDLEDRTCFVRHVSTNPRYPLIDAMALSAEVRRAREKKVRQPTR